MAAHCLLRALLYLAPRPGVEELGHHRGYPEGATAAATPTQSASCLPSRPSDFFRIKRNCNRNRNSTKHSPASLASPSPRVKRAHEPGELGGLTNLRSWASISRLRRERACGASNFAWPSPTARQREPSTPSEGACVTGHHARAPASRA